MATPYKQKRAATAVIDGGAQEFVFLPYQGLALVDVDGGTPHGYNAGSLLLKEPVFYVETQALPFQDVFVDTWQVLDALTTLEIANGVDIETGQLE